MASLLERMNISGAGPTRTKKPISRSSPYNRPPPKGDIDSKWSHDLFDDSLASRMNVSVRPKAVLGPGLQKALSDATGRSPGFNIKGAGQAANVVEVKGLVSGTTAEDVVAIFKRCGTIVNSKKMPGSEVCIRVTFKEAEAAEAAVKKFNGQPADGKILSVQQVGASSVGDSLGGRLGGKDGLGLVRQEGSVDVLMSSDSDGGSKMRSDLLINSDRAQVLVAPPGVDPQEYTQGPGRGGRRGGGRGRGGRRRRGGLSSRMDLD